MLNRFRDRCTLVTALMAVGLLLFAGCEEDRGFAPDSANLDDPGVMAMDAVTVSEATLVAATDAGAVFDYSREIVGDNIAHYSFKLQTGPSPHDVIGIHRVVRERSEGRPIHTQKAAFFQHGDAKNFVGMVLPGLYSPSTPDEFGLAYYLADDGVDVWGIDQSWTLVPDDITDMSFAEGWGIDRQIQDLGTALAIARETRTLTGSGNGRLHLLGYSSGAATGYAYVNYETQLPPGQRHVRGYLPVDLGYKSDDPDYVQLSVTDYGNYEQAMAAGEYLSFIPFALAGTLGRDDPDGASPIIPGFNNLQAALFFGAGPIFGVGAIHYLAGEWDDTGLPIGLQFVTNDQWFDFMQSAPQWEATRFMLDYSAIMGNVYDVPWDDHLGQVEVPILNIAAAGGIGPYSYYVLSFLGSDDIESLTIQLQPDEAAMLDFAHIDIFIAENAPELVWAPVSQWITDHSIGVPKHKKVGASD